MTLATREQPALAPALAAAPTRVAGSGLGSPWRRSPSWLICVAAAYLTLPLLLFLSTWLSAVLLPALLLLLGTLGVGLWSLTGRPAALGRGSCALAALATVGVIAMSGLLGGLHSVKFDWFKHAAITNTLTESPWPTQLPDGVLRYYSGFYLVPSGAARALDADPRLFLAIWFALGLLLGLILLAGALPWRLAAPALLLFVLMSGWDSIGCLVTGLDTCLSLQHLETWSGSVPVNSVLTGLLWRPGQFLPALILVPLILTLRPTDRSLWLLAPLLVATVYWSPFVALGVIPLLLPGVFAVARVRQWRRLGLDCLLPGLLVLPAALLLVLYLAAGSETVPVDMLWSYPQAKIRPWYLGWSAVVAIDVVPLVVLPALLRGLTGVHRTALVFTCLVLLIVFGIFSDLTINATFPFVVLFSWETSYLLTQLVAGRRTRRTAGAGGAAGRRGSMRLTAVAGALIALLAVPTAIQEVAADYSTDVDWWACTVRDEVCIPASLRYQYTAPAGAFPPWFFRSGSAAPPG